METVLINPLGGLMLRRACLDAAQWPGRCPVAVGHLSPAQFFASASLLSIVMDALKQSGLPAENGWSSTITETLLLEKSSQVLATLHALRALGVRISMDDFGTGYSSLSYLRKLSVRQDQDRPVVSCAALPPTATRRRSFVPSSASAKGLGVIITAEGVETEAELSCLRAEGCHEGHGLPVQPRNCPMRRSSNCCRRNAAPTRWHPRHPDRHTVLVA